jgi:hypothetical protein
MGAVWLARDEVLGRDVAVKRIGMVPGGGSADLERAEREARLAARLNHPHVVAVFDLVTEGDERWLVMEYVPGLTLAALVRRDGPLSPDRAAALLRQAADALAAAHGAGIVHRDVKPSNMLVTEDAQVKLSDFGIARAEADASLTQTGLVTGSPAYLAPEVASGSTATPQSDVWSLGATLFHALTGRPPYDVGENVIGALYRIVHDDPPRCEEAGWLAPLLEATMTREPDARWSMARVRDFLGAGPGAAAPAPPPPPPVASAPAPAPVPPAEPTRTDVLAAPPVADGPARRRVGAGPVLVAAAVVLLLGLIGWALLAGQDPEEQAGGDPAGTPSARDSSPSGQESPTAEGMEGFIGDYLATAASDPVTAYGMLTPAFQQQSGGMPGYRGFWDQVESADLLSVEADPQALTVSYTVEYTLDSRGQGSGGTSTDEVSLALVYEDGTYKIADES